MRTLVPIMIAVVFLLATCGAALADSQMAGNAEMVKKDTMEMPFGAADDVAFAKALWTAMAGYEGWVMRSDIYPGKSPHGMFLQVFYNVVNIDGRPYHVIVKNNYGGEGVTLEMVKATPEQYLMAVTPMVQREEGYDAEDNNWFYVKFNADGTIVENDKGLAMAGRVAKGMPMGCIACHRSAGGGDYLFTND